jgi:3-oxoacyl-[acyl-carrier-protein] synthase-3
LAAGAVGSEVLAKPESSASTQAGSGARGELRARVIGIGAAAPETRVANGDLEAVVETSDEWISQRTGIRSRHLMKPGEGLSTLASDAAKRALENAKVDPADVELVILATSSPDDLFGDAAHVAALIGAKNAVAFDLTAACSGFLFAMTTAGQFLHNGAYKTAVVIGGDVLSRWVDWSDRNTCVLFGDGAGAAVLRAAAEGEESGVLGYEMHSNGSGRPDLNLGYGTETQELAKVTTVQNGDYGKIAMNGKEVYKFATTCVPKVLKEALGNAGVEAEQLDWLLMHQANIRIMETVAKKLKIPMDKVITNLDEFGNTSAGSIPLALDQAVRDGKVKKGDLVAVAGFGAGLSWGAAVIRWG